MARRRKRRQVTSAHWGWILVTAVVAFALGLYWAQRRGVDERAQEAPKAEQRPPAAAPTPRSLPEPAPETPAPPPAVPEAERTIIDVEPGSARIALVIDDLGRSATDVERLRGLGIPWTGAVLPFETQTERVAAALRESGVEFLCHLPMQPASANPGPGALRLDMTEVELASATRAALAAVPGAAGVNNHMGSVLSADRQAMRTILRELASRDLYFLDSRTSADSVGYRLALELGLPAVERQVFLDVEANEKAVTAQFHHLLEVARERGAALAIGHPHPYTFAVLERLVPAARAAGYEFVPASYLLDRPAVGGPGMDGDLSLP